MAFNQPSYVSDTATQYKTNIDDSIAYLKGLQDTLDALVDGKDLSGIAQAELDRLAGLTASTAELNKLDGVTISNANMLTLLNNYDEQTVELGGDFDAGMEVKCVRQGNLITISARQDNITCSNVNNANSSSGVIPAQFRPDVNAGVVAKASGVGVEATTIISNGTVTITSLDWSGSFVSRTNRSPFTLSFVVS